MKIKDYTLGSESYLSLRSILYYSYWSDVALKELNIWIDSESTIMSFKTSLQSKVSFFFVLVLMLTNSLKNIVFEKAKKLKRRTRKHKQPMETTVTWKMYKLG